MWNVVATMAVPLPVVWWVLLTGTEVRFKGNVCRLSRRAVAIAYVVPFLVEIGAYYLVDRTLALEVWAFTVGCVVAPFVRRTQACVDGRHQDRVRRGVRTLVGPAAS
jgi:hypothetical protein